MSIIQNSWQLLGFNEINVKKSKYIDETDFSGNLYEHNYLRVLDT